MNYKEGQPEKEDLLQSLEILPFSRQSKERKAIKALYKASFPRAERKPFSMILEGIDKKAMQAWTYHLEGVPAGLAFTIPSKEAVILDYLAVDPSLRSKGIGSAILEHLQSVYQQPLLVEIEEVDDKDPDTLRRKNFYLRNHLREQGIHMRLFGVDMELLSNRPVGFSTYYGLMEEYLRFFSRTSSIVLKKNLYRI